MVFFTPHSISFLFYILNGFNVANTNLKIKVLFQNISKNIYKVDIQKFYRKRLYLNFYSALKQQITNITNMSKQINYIVMCTIYRTEIQTCLNR